MLVLLKTKKVSALIPYTAALTTIGGGRIHRGGEEALKHMSELDRMKLSWVMEYGCKSHSRCLIA